jgi:RHS repeat-associated protein
VYVWYVSNRKYSSSVPYTISHNGLTDTINVDQTGGGGSWQLLASNLTFDGLGSEYVEVSDANGKTTADAVRFVNVGGTSSTETTVYYVHNDHLGTPQAMSDDTGETVWHSTYDPFGKATVNEDVDGDGNTITMNIRFPGQYYDQESGLHYNYFRYYDPSTGRYITSDPIGLAGGLNTYGYVGGNTLNYIDPLGLKCNSNGCWLTPLEATLANKGDYLGYYAVACANGDNYACQARNVAANKGWQARLTNWNLSSALEDNGWQEGCEVDAVMENIRQELALAHALLLSGATENTPKVLSSNEISKFHNDIFFDYGAENDVVPVFGGDFPLSNFFFEWCAAPSCKQ